MKMTTSFQSPDERGHAAAKALLTSLNVMGGEKEFNAAFAEEVFSSHRTLQQNLGRLLFAVIYQGAVQAQEGWSDPRNEGFLNACVQVRDVIGEHGPYLPLV